MTDQHHTRPPHLHTLRRIVVPPKLKPPINPALGKHAQQRAEAVENRVADAITRFAGSMSSSAVIATASPHHEAPLLRSL